VYTTSIIHDSATATVVPLPLLVYMIADTTVKNTAAFKHTQRPVP
jgi:hypothetical protein